MHVLIVGAGGHGQVVADILFHMDALTPIAFVDDNSELHGRRFLGCPVVGHVAERTRVAYDGIVIAIGNNFIRSSLHLQLAQEKIITAIHPRATIAHDVAIGAGTIICANAVVNTGSRIGRSAIINTGATIDHHNLIGDFAHIAPGCHLGGDVTIGEGVLVGIGGVILPQRTVGAWSIVGAGAVVHRDVMPRQTVIGVPAQQLSP